MVVDEGGSCSVVYLRFHHLGMYVVSVWWLFLVPVGVILIIITDG